MSDGGLLFTNLAYSVIGWRRWTRCTAKLDYASRTWDMYVDGVIVGEGLSMCGEATSFGSIEMSGEGVADNLLVTTERPLGLSSDGDALPDEWEIEHFGDLSHDGSEVSYGYDLDGNLASVAYPDETLAFAYDRDGLLLSASSSAGAVSNVFDAATGWLDASTGADGTTVTYSRSNGGSVTSMVSVAGTNTYSHDAAGRISHIASSSAQFGFGYCDWNGLLSEVTNGSGFVVKYMHDIMDRVTNISWRTTSGAAIGGFQYEYDAAGRIVSRRQEIGDPSHPSQMSQSSQKNYAYDDLDRLASDGDVSYTYDAAGNRMTRTKDAETITYTLGVGDRLASWTGGSYAYDFAGNVTRIERDGRPTLDLTWNSQYQLVSVATNGVFAEGYEYDALCRRVSTTTLEGTTRHVYDDSWQVIADIDEQGDVIASYTWGTGIDNLLAVSIGGVTYYPLADIQGTVWGYVDSQNNVVARWQYDAWGNVVDEEIASNAAALASIRYRFQCREWSAATGLTNFRMRWYDPETGRWLSKDPIGLRGGLNLYAFCDCRPAIEVDKYGKSPVVVGAAIAAAGVAYFIYKYFKHAKKTQDRMASAGSDDIRETIDASIDCVGYLFEWFGPHGVCPDASSIITDPIDDIITTPVRDDLLNKMRPRNQRKNRNDNCMGEENFDEIRDL